MIRRYDRQLHETARDRARVAAELLEEARQLTETAMLGLDAGNGSGHGNGNGHNNGNGHTQGNGNGNGSGHAHGNGNGNGHATGTAAARRNRTLASLRPVASEAERTLAELDAAIAAQPDSVSLLLERAKHLGTMGRYSDARADLERGLLLDSTNVTVRSALGIVLLRKGLWASAVPHLRLVVEQESWSPTAWFYLGEALNHADDLDGALAAFGRAAELDPHHAKALYGQGVVLDRLRRPEDAARLYRRSREVAAK
ncbi:MAG TPA: tetratricopeptide repeat protein [Gemmatimonadales bacterium]